jgi:hypothetical protein
MRMRKMMKKSTRTSTLRIKTRRLKLRLLRTATFSNNLSMIMGRTMRMKKKVTLSYLHRIITKISWKLKSYKLRYPKRTLTISCTNALSTCHHSCPKNLCDFPKSSTTILTTLWTMFISWLGKVPNCREIKLYFSKYQQILGLQDLNCSLRKTNLPRSMKIWSNSRLNCAESTLGLILFFKYF